MSFFKVPTYRNQKWLRAVASMPCQNCGRTDVQAAHANMQALGKGMGIKASDAALMALCCKCHAELDSGSSMTKDEKRLFQFEMIAKTHVSAMELGLLEVKK
jgi:hypothetical protein